MNIFFLLFSIIIVLPAFPSDCDNNTCGKIKSVDDLFSTNKVKKLDNFNNKQTGILIKPDGISAINSDLKEEKKETFKEENNKIIPIPEITDKNKEKKVLENPTFLIVWILILFFLYFYLKERRKRRRK